MSPDYTEDDLDRAQAKPRKGGKIPHPPPRAASFSEVRQWLSDAAGLPPEVRIETVIRSGREPENPCTIVLSNDTKLRCPHQSRLQQPRTLQAFLASESDGIAQPPYLSPAEVGDWYTQLCRLGTIAASRSDPVADLQERLEMFIRECQTIPMSITDHAARFTTIDSLRSRPAYDRASIMDRNNGFPIQPVLLHDPADEKRYIRASEFVAWLRFSQGWKVNESQLVGRMAELGSDRSDPQAWNADRSRKVHLVFYSVPEDL